MTGPIFIQSDRIHLRTIEKEDISFLQQKMNIPAARRYAGADISDNHRRYEEDRFDPISSGDFVQLLVRNDERLGDVSLAPIDERRG
jgi:hypothetical protein